MCGSGFGHAGVRAGADVRVSGCCILQRGDAGCMLQMETGVLPLSAYACCWLSCKASLWSSQGHVQLAFAQPMQGVRLCF